MKIIEYTGRAARRAIIAAATLSAATLIGAAAEAGSLRFNGNGRDDIDRVKIRIDDPANNNPGPPADIGNGAFTIEFWIKGSLADNNNVIAANRCVQGVYGWIDGNIVIDRDRYELPRSWGLSLGQGRVAFGVNVDNVGITTVCGDQSVLDNQWHHVAVTRATNGTISIFVDGELDQSAAGPTGDLSYPDNGQPQGNNCGGAPCINSDPFIVIGAEKHDANPGNLDFNGFVDEVRLSNNARYPASGFPVSTIPLTADPNTVALYHFDEQTSGNCTEGTVIRDEDGNASPGVCRFGGSPGGPVWSTDSPFAAVPSAGVLQFSSGTGLVAESAPSVTLEVTRTGGMTGAVSVNYATANGTATAGSDYTATSGTLNWATGVSTAQNITVPIIEDTAAEGDQTFTVSLSGPTGGATVDTALATVTIDDNDAPGTLQLSAASYAASEGTPTRVITVARLNGSAGPAMVNYATSDGTAVQGGDYTTATGTLQWNAGQTGDRTFNVTIADDAQVETAETFTVTLSNASGAGLGVPSSATVTIADNDATPGTLQLTQDAFTVGEAGGTLTLSVSRANGTAGGASVRISTTSGSAIAGSDFQALDQTLSWAAGEGGTKTATLTITNDSADEQAETLTVALSNALAAPLGTPASATVTINDDDASTPPPSNSDGGGGGSSSHAFLLLMLVLLASKLDALHFRRARGILPRRL